MVHTLVGTESGDPEKGSVVWRLQLVCAWGSLEVGTEKGLANGRLSF